MADTIRDNRVKQPDGQDVYDATEVRRVDDTDLVEIDDADLVDVEEASARDGGDVSPHLGGRAQPGDVLGIETGGETTGIGDTAEDEDERRRDREKAAGEHVHDLKNDKP